MWLTWTNLKYKDICQAKEDTFFLIFVYLKKKKKSIFAAFEEGQHPKNGHTFCLDCYLAHPWQW